MIARLRALGLDGSLRTAGFVVAGTVAAGLMGNAQTAPDKGTAASIYSANCAICHGEDGSGTALGNRLKVRDLRSREVQETPSAVLARTISAGKGNMPAFGAKLQNEEIMELTEYIRHKRAKGH
jgi:mono/diheme cytochrome c family protein